MAAFADLSEVVNRATGGNSGTPETIWFYKAPRVAGVAAPSVISNQWTSLWTYDGIPGAGTAPGVVATPDNATSGGFKQTDPGGGRQKWMFGAGASANATGGLLIYDRLLHISGFDGTSASPQNVGGSITRYTSGTGNMAWVEIYSQIGATSRTVTMSYTDPNNGSGRTSAAVAIGNTNFREQCRAIMLPLASGDTGITAVASVTLSATTGSVGNFGVTVGHPLMFIPISGSTVGIRDAISGLPGMPEVLTDACLGLLWVGAASTTPEITGWLPMAER